MSDYWPAAAVGHGLVALAFMAIAIIVGRNLSNGRQWRINPLGVATVVIFGTSAVAHGIHLLRLTGVGGQDASAMLSARAVLGTPLMVAWILLAATVALGYLLQRTRLATLQGSQALVVDLAQRQEDARRIQAEVLAKAREARDKIADGDLAGAAEELEETVDHAKVIVRDLLPPGGRIEPGAVRREAYDA